MTSERWTTRRLSPRGGGAREGWWGVSDAANLFLDQLAVWRELSFNGCEWFPRYMDYQSFPSWARETLEAHGSDSRRRYTFETLESAATHDPIWNATQRQLLTEGWFHGYLRMLWGKKILEWAPDRPTALAWMETLMNRYSLDGRDPVSYAGFAWVLGRYDRPWPERPVFGTVYVVRERQAKAPDVRVFEAVQLRSASRLVLARGAEADRFTSTTPDRYVLCTTTLSAGVRGMGPAKEHHGRRNEEPHGRAG
jgi:deoxyribodipyrimidine photo-lyase